jgi:hypothetical protein
MVAGQDYYIVPPNILNEIAPPGSGSFSNQNSLKETKPHGTCAASMAVGTTWGVAKNAKMIPVKFKNEAATRPAALQDAFLWVINDVISNDREGKAVINLSYGRRIANLTPHANIQELTCCRVFHCKWTVRNYS